MHFSITFFVLLYECKINFFHENCLVRKHAYFSNKNLTHFVKTFKTQLLITQMDTIVQFFDDKNLNVTTKTIVFLFRNKK